MSAGRFEVGGRVFYNKTDYEAALRDYEKIKEIKTEFDLSNAEDIRQVYSYLTSGTYRFESVIGDDFDDEVYKLFSDIKNNIVADVQQKKEQRIRNKNKKVSRQTSLDDFDEELKEAVKKEIKKQEYRRKVLILAFSLIS